MVRQKRTEGLDDVGPGLTEQGPVSVVRNADGSAFFKPAIPPRAWHRLMPEAREVIANVQSIAAQIHEMQGHLGMHVLEAREMGASWDVIGWSVGTTGNAARQRWGDG
jgi:hypothetical protein